MKHTHNDIKQQLVQIEPQEEDKSYKTRRLRTPYRANFSSSPNRLDRLWGPPILLSNGYWGLFPQGYSGRGVKLSTHLQLNPTSRKCGSIHPLPNKASCQSQWPRGLRHELSSLARTLGLWIRISLEAWMSVRVYSVFVLGSGLAMG
jgi:hypothetical protein